MLDQAAGRTKSCADEGASDCRPLCERRGQSHDAFFIDHGRRRAPGARGNGFEPQAVAWIEPPEPTGDGDDLQVGLPCPHLEPPIEHAGRMDREIERRQAAPVALAGVASELHRVIAAGRRDAGADEGAHERLAGGDSVEQPIQGYASRRPHTAPDADQGRRHYTPDGLDRRQRQGASG